jgi:hypothetical protein
LRDLDSRETKEEGGKKRKGTLAKRKEDERKEEALYDSQETRSALEGQREVQLIVHVRIFAIA